MTVLPSFEHTIFSANQDIYRRNKDWSKDETQSKRLGMFEDRYYHFKHSCAWQMGQGIWAAIQTIFTLGLALISDYTRRTWQQACSGKEWAIVHIKHKDGGDGDGNNSIPPSITTPIKQPKKPLVKPIDNVHPPKPVRNKPIKPPVTNPITQPVVNWTPLSYSKPVYKQPAKIQNTGIIVDPNGLDMTGFSVSDRKLFRAIEATFPVINTIEDNVGKKNSDLSAAALWRNKAPINELISAFDEILDTFKDPNNAYRTDYGFISGFEDRLFDIQIGAQVQEYFANVNNDSSGFSLRYRSLLGMRNLVRYGAEILDELNEKLFIASRDLYDGFPLMKGLQKLFYYTGNAVDLEWPLGSNTDDSQATKDAKKLIEAFKKRFASFADASGRFPINRNLDNWSKAIPTYNGHTERGLCPVWKRKISSRAHYFANVPNVPAIVSSLLKGPLLFAQSYLILKNKKQPIAPLYGDSSLSMKCFNDKLETAQMFNMECQELLKATPKSIGIAQFGQSAVDTALTGADLTPFFEDDTIRPPKNETAAKELKEMSAMPGKQQKTAFANWQAKNNQDHQKMLKDKVDAFLKKAEKIGWKDVLFYDELAKKYKPFDRNVVEEQLEAIIKGEHVDMLAGMADEVHYI